MICNSSLVLAEVPLCVAALVTLIGVFNVLAPG